MSGTPGTYLPQWAMGASMQDRTARSPSSGRANPIHVAADPSPKASRHEALRALHQELAKTEQNVHDLLHSRPA